MYIIYEKGLALGEIFSWRGARKSQSSGLVQEVCNLTLRCKGTCGIDGLMSKHDPWC